MTDPQAPQPAPTPCNCPNVGACDGSCAPYNQPAPATFDLTEARAIVVDAIRRMRAGHVACSDLEHSAEEFLRATHAAAKSDQLWNQTLEERDRYHEIADRLAQAIAKHLEVDIGEHSSANRPWDRALEALDEAEGVPIPPMYATEINRLRNVIQAACTGGLGHMLERWKQLFPEAPVPTVQAFQAPEGAELPPLPDEWIEGAFTDAEKGYAYEFTHTLSVVPFTAAVRVIRAAYARAALAAQPSAEPTDFQLEQLFDAAHHFGDYGREFRERARVILKASPAPAEGDAVLRKLAAVCEGSMAWPYVANLVMQARAALASQVQPKGTVECEEERPTNRYLFKYMCKMAGIELGVDKIDVALKKVAQAMRLQAPAPGAEHSDEHLMNFLAPWVIADDPKDRADFLAALRAALSAAPVSAFGSQP